MSEIKTLKVATEAEFIILRIYDMSKPDAEKKEARFVNKLNQDKNVVH